MKKSWQIIASSLSESLLNDLTRFGLPIAGEFREYATIDTFLPYLNNNEKIKQFLAGLTDTVGSVAKTHRRFSDKFQIVSYEFKGKNFHLVSQLYDLFKKIGCTPDQVLWNHPNQHSGYDRYYKSWKKGFKIRVGLNDYMLYGKFLGLAKQLSAQENLMLQSDGISTTQAKISRIERSSCIHKDESDKWLPEYIRGYHFIHNSHFLAFLGHSVTNEQEALVLALDNTEKFISPFTILTKRTIEETEEIIQQETYLQKSIYTPADILIDELIEMYEQSPSRLLWGRNELDGFPVEIIMQGISYLFSATTGKNLKGKRVLGNYMDNIHEHIVDGYNIQIIYLIPNRGTCMILKTEKYACLVGYRNNDFTKTLITRDGLYGLKVREPQYEECIELI